MTFFFTTRLPCLAIIFLLLHLPEKTRASEIDFERDILSILNESCLDCHGPDEQESNFRVDSRIALLKGGDYGVSAIKPGDPDKSPLITAIGYDDPDLKMPPDEKISDDKIAILKRWVKEGAVWPGQMDAKVVREKSNHWAFQPIDRPNIPSIALGEPKVTSRTASESPDATQVSPIDAFLLDRLAQDDLHFSPAADPRSLLRRTSIVVTGIAPTPEETIDFLAVWAKDSERAYADLVDRLLGSPHFGERWAQHWLDVIRWAETNGSESNMYRKNAWIYRDYVIRSFNEDKPYDRFLFEQIAGDTLAQGDATGYLVSGPHVPLATVGREETARRQARADRMDEILQTVGASALGMTIGCARCHNHKFDPISIHDYYSMAAVFQDIEFGSRFPEFGEDHPRRIRGQELYRQINQLRSTLREMGPWEENWIGYKELYIPPTLTRSVRITFLSNFVRIDELEILGTEDRNRNFALASEGTELDYSKEGTAPGSPVHRINDGQFGNDSWIVRAKKDSPEKPWIQLTFKAPHEVNRIRLSTNKEDYLETDYLDDLNKLNFEPYKVEVQAESGEWTQVAGPKQFELLNQKYPVRVSIAQELQALIEQATEEGPKPSFVVRMIQPVKTFVLSRGSPENPGDEVYPAGLTELNGDLGLDPDATGKERRQAFARWVIARDNPLTARVAVNRLWHHIFGQGIVTTTSDFGAAGALPTHPKLLEWLAAELIEPSNDFLDGNVSLDKPPRPERAAAIQPWSMKHMIRLMVMSRAFRQSSLPDTKALEVDADSALLWRFPPKRIEAEVIRDSILQASGVLDRTIGGRSFRIHNVKKRYAQWEIQDNHGPNTWRRMLYQERMRRVDDQLFTAFDFPDCGQVQAKRPVSTTPLQALNLLNSDFVIEQSERIATRANKEARGEMHLAIRRCFVLLLSREPASDELEACLELAQRTNLSLVCRTLMNTNEFAFLP